MHEKSNLLWRIINTSLLVFALFSPWEVIYGDTSPAFSFEIPGWEVILISVLVVIESPELLGYVRGTLIDVGNLGLALYIVMNCILLVTNRRLLTKPFQGLLLIIILLSFLLVLRIGELRFNGGLTWGYWLTCAVLFSSLFLEILGQLPLKSPKNRIS